jgi:hypothetical protein
MSWKNEYLSRAQRICTLRSTLSSVDDVTEINLLEISLEDDLAGKLSVFQCLELLDWVQDMPYSQSTGMLMSLMPKSLHEYTSDHWWG